MAKLNPLPSSIDVPHSDCSASVACFWNHLVVTSPELIFGYNGPSLGANYVVWLCSWGKQTSTHLKGSIRWAIFSSLLAHAVSLSFATPADTVSHVYKHKIWQVCAGVGVWGANVTRNLLLTPPISRQTHGLPPQKQQKILYSWLSMSDCGLGTQIRDTTNSTFQCADGFMKFLYSQKEERGKWRHFSHILVETLLTAKQRNLCCGLQMLSRGILSRTSRRS